MSDTKEVIATCCDTMLTTLEKLGGQSLICSWTRRDGSVVKLALEIRTSDQNTVADCIRDMDDEEMAKRLIPIVVHQMCAYVVPTEEEALKWLQQPASCLKEQGGQNGRTPQD